MAGTLSRDQGRFFRPLLSWASQAFVDSKQWNAYQGQQLIQEMCLACVQSSGDSVDSANRMMEKQMVVASCDLWEHASVAFWVSSSQHGMLSTLNMMQMLPLPQACIIDVQPSQHLDDGSHTFPADARPVAGR